MQPCYQLCKDRNCPHWNEELMDCERLPDDCEYVVDQLVSERENQFLNGFKHGKWQLRFPSGKLLRELTYVDGFTDGVWRQWYENGQLEMEENYKNGLLNGLFRRWTETGKLYKEIAYVDGDEVGGRTFEDGRVMEYGCMATS